MVKRSIVYVNPYNGFKSPNRELVEENLKKENKKFPPYKIVGTNHYQKVIFKLVGGTSRERKLTREEVMKDPLKGLYD